MPDTPKISRCHRVPVSKSPSVQQTDRSVTCEFVIPAELPAATGAWQPHEGAAGKPGRCTPDIEMAFVVGARLESSGPHPDIPNGLRREGTGDPRVVEAVFDALIGDSYLSLGITLPWEAHTAA
jgi:hypothetical protein